MSSQLQFGPEQGLIQPLSLLPSLRQIAFVCPLCKGPLSITKTRDAYYCRSCERGYSLQGGIPDFRVYPDPYLSFEEDHKRTEIMLEALNRYEFKELLEYYWTFSDITPVALRPKFIRNAILGEQRARHVVNLLEKQSSQQRGAKQQVLEVGSGTGNFLALATQHYDQVIGTDIAMRWLHVSRRRFMDLDLPVPPLVCCCAEYLPFPDSSFDLVIASSTLEFVRGREETLAECARALKSSGSLHLNTVNRFSLAINPYVYLWGVGFLPERLQARYVKWRIGSNYEPIKLFSLPALMKAAKKHFRSVVFLLPEVDSSSLKQFSRATRLQAQAYRVIKKLPVFKTLLKWVAPSWDVILKERRRIS